MARGAIARIAAGACLLLVSAVTANAQQARFDWFEYRGHDRIFDTPLPGGHYRNPILAGFHADPSITRAGDRYYLVNSSFTYFPGIPVFESMDLVHWTLVGHVIDRPSQLDFDGLSVSRGVFAPAIEFHDGTFYVVTTAVDNGGNFLVTAKDPAGPWSDPIWLPTIEGIDPSLFFDDDGRAYLLNNGEPEGTPRYDGHRAIWMQEIDLARNQPVGPRRVLLDGGVDPARNPIWIEGPHLFKHGGWYYLTCAEGGTGPQHSQVVLRSRQRWGPFVPYPRNPILTQRDLPDDRADPITNAGHADLIRTPQGDWWAVFLASRNYGGVHYNTGRETFLLPVTWKDGWPVVLDAGSVIPHVAKSPTRLHESKLPPSPSGRRGREAPDEGRAAAKPALAEPAPQADAARLALSRGKSGLDPPSTGNFSWRDDFNAPRLDPAWRFVRVPKTRWVDLQSQAGTLTLAAASEGLDTLKNPHFLARRQQHTAFDASAAMLWPDVGVEAGIAAFQNERYWISLSVRVREEGGEVVLERHRGEQRELIARQALARTDAVILKMTADGGRYDFGFDAGNGTQWLRKGEDGSVLSTDVAGGFVGASIGPYARTLEGDADGVAP